MKILLIIFTSFGSLWLLNSSGNERIYPNILVSRLTDGYWQIWEVSISENRSVQITRDDGDKRTPFVTPEGELGFRTSNGQVYAIDGVDGKYRRLCESIDIVNDLAWSPDGKWLAAAEISESIADKIYILLISVLTGEKRELVCGNGCHYQVDWSPDGRRLAFSSGSGPGGHELQIINLENEDRIQLTDNDWDEFHAAWSPDGQWLAYSSDQTGDYEIWLLPSDGTGEAIQLTKSPGIDDFPLWTPDGKEIVFTTNRNKKLEVWVMSMDGSDQRILIDDESEITGACWKGMKLTDEKYVQ